MPKLFEEGNDNNLKIEINKDYAKKYDLWREKEEHQKLKDKYGDLNIEERCYTLSSSSDTDSELEKDAFDPKIEEEFDNTLKMLKEKNPKIYNNEFMFFNGNQIELNSRHQSLGKNSKKMTINDYERHIIQNKGGVYTDDEKDEGKNNVKSNTYVQEQKLLKDCFKKAIHPESENEDEFFKVLPVFKGALNFPVETECDSVKDDSLFPEYNSLKNLFDKYGIQEDENLMPDETTCEANNIRTLDESRVSSGDENEASNCQPKPTQQQHRYRFEEMEEKEAANGPNNAIASFSFPRILPPEVSSSLLRKPKARNEKRKAHREARLTKKKAEKVKILEETKRLRSFKLQAIRRKVSKLEKVSGLSHLDSLLTLEDIEKDYDPEKFDRMINRMFDEKYYEDDKTDIKKPVFHETDDEIEDMKEKRLSNFNSEGNTKSTEIIQGKLSVNENYETRKELESLKSDLDEYLNLNFGGIVAGKPTRFKYRKVVPNQFGLTIDEILGADDKELNKWVSLKKMVQYRTDQEEKFDLHAYDIKGKQFFKKKTILNSIYAPKPETLTENTHSEDENNGGLKTNDLKKLCSNGYPNTLDKTVLDVAKCKPKRSTDPELEENKIQFLDENKLTQNLTKVDKKVKKHDPNSKTFQLVPSDQRLLLYGINPKVYKKKLKYKQVKKNVT